MKIEQIVKNYFISLENMPKLEDIPSFKSGTFKQSNSQLESRSNIMARRQNKRITGIINKKKDAGNLPKRKQHNDHNLEFDSDEKNQNSSPDRDKLNRSVMSKEKFSSNSEESILRTSKVNPMELTVQHFKRPSKSEIDDDSIEAFAKINSQNEKKAGVNSNNSNNKNLNANDQSSPSNPKTAHKNGTSGNNINNQNSINNQTSNHNNPKDQTNQINPKNQPTENNQINPNNPNSQPNAKSSNDSNNSNRILDPPSSSNIIREILQEREREMKKNVESSSKIETAFPLDGKQFQPTEEEQIMLDSIKLFFQKIQPNV
jgi:hypothetical protein